MLLGSMAEAEKEARVRDISPASLAQDRGHRKFPSQNSATAQIGTPGHGK